MKRWMVLLLALGIGSASYGCVTKEKSEDKKSSTSDDDEDDDTKSKSKKSKGKDDDKGKSEKASDDSDKRKQAEKPAAEVDAKKLLEEDGGETSNVLDVKLPDDDKRDAPSLGGGSISAAQGPALRWLSAGPLAVPNPGWKEVNDPPATVLVSPDEKAAIVFAPFTTPKDGATKVDRVVAYFKLTNAKWKKAKQVTVGPNKVPALFGSGTATTRDGKPAKLFFSLIKSGGPQNLLAIGIANADAPESSLKTGLNIIGSIKRQ